MTENHPVPSLLNLSTRRRGDVDPTETSFGLRKDENEKYRLVGGIGARIA